MTLEEDGFLGADNVANEETWRQDYTSTLIGSLDLVGQDWLGLDI